MRSRREDPRLANGAATLPELQQRTAALGSARDFVGSLRSAAERDGVALIAEIKKASPSRGPLAPGLDVARQAASYEEAGAAAVSVVTEPHHFAGSLELLAEARAACRLPILRKDFLTEPWEIWETRVRGADAVLLIAALLDDDRLRLLADEAGRAGLGVLIEVHNEREMVRALETNPQVLGINNRDLASFEVTLETTLRLACGVPRDVLLVSESGIASREDVLRVAEAGARAVLVGESLVRHGDPVSHARSLLGLKNERISQ